MIIWQQANTTGAFPLLGLQNGGQGRGGHTLGVHTTRILIAAHDCAHGPCNATTYNTPQLGGHNKCSTPQALHAGANLGRIDQHKRHDSAAQATAREFIHPAAPVLLMSCQTLSFRRAALDCLHPTVHCSHHPHSTHTTPLRLVWHNPFRPCCPAPSSIPACSVHTWSPKEKGTHTTPLHKQPFQGALPPRAFIQPCTAAGTPMPAMPAAAQLSAIGSSRWLHLLLMRPTSSASGLQDPCTRKAR